MGSEREQGKLIRTFALNAASFFPVDLVSRICRHFKITRQAASIHVRKLIDQGFLTKAGRTRSTRYQLTSLDDVSFDFPLPGSPDESTVYTTRIRPRLNVKEHVQELLSYGFSEMFNNAIDHSEGTQIRVHYRRTAASTVISISDNGVGIFNKIAQAFHLSDPRESILELSKGKLTTDHARHSGEGIFFTSRLMDKFAIASGRLLFTHDTVFEDWLLEREGNSAGTTVHMEVLHDTERSTLKVFEQFSTDPDEQNFDRTHVPLSLAQYDTLVSRSQAKRVLSRFERFREVTLDFKGVKSIGQGFADEIFRVYARSPSAAKITYLRASAQVDRMIKRVLAAASQDDDSLLAIGQAQMELGISQARPAAYGFSTAGGEFTVLKWEPTDDRLTGSISVQQGLFPMPLTDAPLELRMQVIPHLKAFVDHVRAMDRFAAGDKTPKPKA